ncbi:MAG: hypothetical protein ACREMW_09830 [Gemmatimonadales bacterium]
MINTTKTLPVVIPSVLGLGIAMAVVSNRPPRERHATIPAGTTLVVVLEQSVSTLRSHPGDEIVLHTVLPVRAGNGAEIPEGSLISGQVTDSRSGGQNDGPPELGLRFTSLKIDGDIHEIRTEQFRFGTLRRATQGDQIVLPVGRRIKIRLSRPLTVETRPGPEQTQAAE